MTHRPSDGDRTHRLLQGYLLDTLGWFARRRVERHLASSPEWRVALETERKALAVLDHLELEAPRRDLTGAVMNRIREENVKAAMKKRHASNVWVLAVSMLVVIVLGAVLLPSLARSREAARRASTQNTLKQWGVVLKMYAGEDPQGRFPPLTRYDDAWVPDLERLYPDFVSDADIFINPSLPDAQKLSDRVKTLLKENPVNWQEITRIAAKSFIYSGWTMRNEADAERITSERFNLAKADYDPDLPAPAERFSGEGVRRLREGVERFAITDINNPAGASQIQRTVPVMFEGDLALHKGSKGCNVLYMDGHVAFVEEGKAFPATDATMKAFHPSRN